jgi:hypothetical protein
LAHFLEHTERAGGVSGLGAEAEVALTGWDFAF